MLNTEKFVRCHHVLYRTTCIFYQHQSAVLHVILSLVTVMYDKKILSSLQVLSVSDIVLSFLFATLSLDYSEIVSMETSSLSHKSIKNMPNTLVGFKMSIVRLSLSTTARLDCPQCMCDRN